MHSMWETADPGRQLPDCLSPVLFHHRFLLYKVVSEQCVLGRTCTALKHIALETLTGMSMKRCATHSAEMRMPVVARKCEARSGTYLYTLWWCIVSMHRSLLYKPVSVAWWMGALVRTDTRTLLDTLPYEQEASCESRGRVCEAQSSHGLV